MPPAGNWVSFACSIPPLFVLSHSLPMVNTMGKLALFWRFSIPVVSASSISPATGYWPLFSCHWPPLATRHFLQIHWPLFSHPPPGPAGSGRAQTLPRWLLPDTDMRIVKDRTGPDLDERPVYFSMSPNRAIPSDKSNFSSPHAAARPLTIRSRPEALNAKGSKRPAGCPSNACTVLVPPSHNFVNQHPEKQVALTLDMRPASDMMNGNTL